MRLLKTVLILSVLTLLPALSWVYLTKGRDWRRDRVLELENLGEMPQFEVQSTSNVLLSPSTILGKNLIVHRSVSSDAIEIIGKLHDQFNEREDYLFLQYGDLNDPEAVTEDPEQWLLVDCASAACTTVDQLFDEKDATTVLVDKDGYVRHFYDLSQDGSAAKLVEHMAVLIPIEKRARLQLRRDLMKQQSDAGK